VSCRSWPAELAATRGLSIRVIGSDGRALVCLSGPVLVDPSSEVREGPLALLSRPSVPDSPFSNQIRDSDFGVNDVDGRHAIGLVHELDVLEDIRRFFLEDAVDLNRQQTNFRVGVDAAA